MTLNRYIATVVLLIVSFCKPAAPVLAQYGVSLDIKKPPEYDNRVLRSEKSDKKKFPVTSRFVQNTTTHYNYFFNANNKLTEILEKAKASFKDDYSQLISFYNYSLDVTAADTILIDSISYKAQTGIVLHDLRSDWADNLYLLWGISYYLKKNFDTAYLMFQFINYAFAEKEKDGYYRTIGSSMDGNNAFSISTKEKNSFTRRLFTMPPSRNEAFIWQIRTFLAQEKYTQAGSLISILKNDPVFPGRLKNDLEEVQAYFFYKQKTWDSAALHLSNALSNATTQQEKARWEYLVAQLYELAGDYDDARSYYADAIHHTTDPIMDIYARLASIRVNKEEGEDYIGKNIDALVKMGKRDKYTDYRDIIYFMAAQMELERENTDGAIAMLLKSTKYTSNNPSQRNKAFLQLAELSFSKRRYRHAYNFYDSLNLADPELKDPEAITKRKNILERLANNVEIIERQDSLQRIAAMPEDERRSFVKKLARQLRKQQGLKGEDNTGSFTPITTPSQQTTPASLFNDDKKGEWYFYNSNLRQKGLADFKARWGNRPNADNWRRSAVLANIIRPQINNINDQMKVDVQDAKQQSTEESEITFEGLYEKLPLTQLALQQSNDSINTAMFALGLIYIQELEDCEAGTKTFEELRLRSPDHPKMDEILFNLYYCNSKRKGSETAYTLKKELTEKYPNSNFTTIVTTGKNPEAAGDQEATKAYERIYDLFIEGNFSEAIAQKKIADSLYSHNFWTPQLLYIEAVYYIRQRDDSTAKTVLNNIITQFKDTPLEEKARTMLDVLNRRKQIEEELRNMVVVMPPPDTARRYRDIYTDSMAKKPPVAIQPAKTDSIVALQPVVPPPVAVNTNPQVDTIAKTPVILTSAYTFETEKPYYVAIMLSKVDPIFVTEAKNAFSRYNRSTYYNKQMTAELIEIDADNHILLIDPFKNLQEALDYIDKTKPKTSTEIIPWLKGGKYNYSVITANNLELLKNSKDIEKYNQFLNQHLPGRF